MYTTDPVAAHPRYRSCSTPAGSPNSPDEVALAPTSARAIGARTFSALRDHPDRLEGVRRRATVTGIAFVPVGSHNSYDDGGWLTHGWVRPAVRPTASSSTSGRSWFGRGSMRPVADPSADRGRPQRPPVRRPDSVPTGRRPVPEVAQIRDVQVLPIVLGGFLALLALGAVGHALGTAVRRRRHDISVLRALGMTRRQARGVVPVTQASVLAVIGLLFGIPLGFALGRALWRAVAESTPLHYVPPVALLALALVAPVVLVVVNLLAAPPRRGERPGCASARYYERSERHDAPPPPPPPVVGVTLPGCAYARRRWRSLLVLALLIALATATCFGRAGRAAGRPRSTGSVPHPARDLTCCPTSRASTGPGSGPCPRSPR